MTILIITRSDDNDCIQSVSDAIVERGGKVFRLDTDLFPTEIRLAASVGRNGHGVRVQRHGQEVDLREVSALWYRRFRAGAAIPQEMDKQLRDASVLESRRTMLGLIASLPVFQLDPVHLVRRAENKQLQLEIAQRVGLEIPPTLITNDPEAVRRFAQECGEGMVVKMLSSFAIFEGDRQSVVFTNVVTPEHLQDLDGLRLCPMTFQKRVPKSLELRATIVGDSIFTASIDSQALERAQDDWRREGAALVDRWRKYDLPTVIRDRLLQLMDGLGLNYGAADFILTPDGRHVFLELNPAGEFFWLDRWPGLPISQSIAHILLDGARRRQVPESIPARRVLSP
ncbi:MAG: hypothetical protein L0Y44_16215 [Phycisphaerales bacterium]|nr:hypothetical protein [Phycisphaerales bacterium]